MDSQAAAAVMIAQALLIAGLVAGHLRRRHAEAEGRRRLANMAHLDRRAAMGELATSLAHEINQPLNAILQNASAAQMILARPDPSLDELRDIVNDIKADDERAGDVIRGMRALLQKRELSRAPLDVNAFARDTVALTCADAAARGIQVDLQLADGLPRIQGDRVHLQQVLLNLLLNGMDAVSGMPPERRRLQVRSARHDGHVELSVKDRGGGITTEPRSQIFEAFYTTKGTGMGVGLSIARSIVDAHDGKVGAENNADGGATVWFSLPAGKAS